MAKKRILQIIPAPGWLGMYRVEGTEDVETSAIACWALVEGEDGATSVEGMDAEARIDFAEEMGNFLGYVHESDMDTEEESG